MYCNLLLNYENQEYDLKIKFPNLQYHYANHKGIALRVGSIQNENVIARKLFDIELGLFASADYVAKRGMPHSPSELYGHELIYKRWRAVAVSL